MVDPLTHNVFVGNQNDSTVSVIDGAICNALDTAGCDQTPPQVATGYNPGDLDIDFATDTVYVTNQGDNDVSVLNGAACTLTHQAGCRHEPPTTMVGNGPYQLAIDDLTHTVYVANQDSNDVSVINAATCNAFVPFGCGRTWPTVATGNFTSGVAVDQATDTIYVANQGTPTAPGTTVSVIDGATCNATVTTGCGQTPPTVTVGMFPFNVAIDQATDTVYVTNQGTRTAQGTTVSVIDGATCNATVMTGCGQTPPTVTVGQSPFALAVNQATNTVYVPNSGSNTVSVIDGATCDATVTTGCGQTPPTVTVGAEPLNAAVDQATDTVYVTTGFSAHLHRLATDGGDKRGQLQRQRHLRLWADSGDNDDRRRGVGPGCRPGH